jgi:hypothetical protein
VVHLGSLVLDKKVGSSSEKMIAYNLVQVQFRDSSLKKIIWPKGDFVIRVKMISLLLFGAIVSLSWIQTRKPGWENKLKI